MEELPASDAFIAQFMECDIATDDAIDDSVGEVSGGSFMNDATVGSEEDMEYEHGVGNDGMEDMDLDFARFEIDDVTNAMLDVNLTIVHFKNKKANPCFKVIDGTNELEMVNIPGLTPGDLIVKFNGKDVRGLENPSFVAKERQRISMTVLSQDFDPALDILSKDFQVFLQLFSPQATF